MNSFFDHKRFLLLTVFGGALVLVSFQTDAFSQRSSGGIAAREQQFISQPFVGVTTNSGIQNGLFSIQSTDVTTEPVRAAAQAFLSVLSKEQKDRIKFAVDDPEWRRWANQHHLPRQGISMQELDEKQREAAFDLMRIGLSTKGFKRSRDIMRLNHTLGELTSNFEEFGEWLYFLTFMGEPSADQPWGWQLDGHHLIVNYFVLGDQVVMTPTFMGSEPVIAESGKYKSVAVMQDEMRSGLELIQSLEDDQRSRAVIHAAKDTNNALAEAFQDNLILDYAGIPAKDLTESQRTLLVSVIEEYVGNMDDGHGRVKMTQVRKHLDQTYLAWIGGYDEDSVFYYRIHSPVVLIEFDHQRPVFMRLPRRPSRQHVHSVMRTPNGNDYGKDLLRLHYERSHSNSAD